MDSIRNRARENFPSVLLTLLSIVQAIALESLWDHALLRPDLFDASWAAFLGWLQIAASLQMIILIWLVYVGLVMRFRFTPTLADLILPFVVGLIEFLMIEIMGPEKLGIWFLVVALISAMMYLLTHRLMRRARCDPDNQELFEKMAPATWRDFVPQIVSVMVAILFGIWLWQSGDYGWIALGALLATWIAIGYEIRVNVYFWRVSMGNH